MSQYPPTPSFGGPYSYAQQWPPGAYATSKSSAPRDPNTFAPNPSMQAFDFNNAVVFPAGPQLPGLGVPSGSVSQPNFTNQFPNNQYSASFFDRANSSQGQQTTTQQFYSPFNSMPPATAASVQTPPGQMLPSQNTQGTLLSILSDDTGKEEGEVSDINESSGCDSTDQAVRGLSALRASQHGGQYESAPLPKGRQVTEREVPSSQVHPATIYDTQDVFVRPDGHGLPDKSLSNRDASESPYMPPIAINLVPPEGVQVARQHCKGSETQAIFNGTKDYSLSYLAGKTPPQIRVMAQGALLGLAPHNIRYNELVKENIDPTILKKLYDEIGIKIAPSDTGVRTGSEIGNSSSSVVAASVENGLRSAPRNAGGYGGDGQRDISPLDQPSSSRTSDSRIAVDPSTVAESSNVKATSALAQDRPLERKEVIARMLAAKANKKTSVPNTTKKSAAELVLSADSAANKPPDTLQSVPSIDSQPKTKNKAQTELARQRIEQLKKQGFPKRPPPVQSDVSSQSSSQQSSTVAQDSVAQAAVTLHHPLPQRPPLPVIRPAASIPGLSMNSSDNSSQAPSPVSQVGVIDSSKEPRNTPRKRPRASDFDEPVVTSKKQWAEGRLVIDISDDESLYDDENATQAQPSTVNRSIAMDQLLPLTDFPPRKSIALTHERISAPGTPHTSARLSDQESLRKKDLEIQAMRQRIAEHEAKKKTKLGNPTPSLESSNVAPDPIPVQRDARAVSSVSNHSGLYRSPSIQSLESMDHSDLDRLRQKLLRRDEIKSGLPALEAELLRSEAKLAEFKKEEEKLMAEIKKGRDGKSNLIAELESLGVETEGLTLDELHAAKAEIKGRGPLGSARVSEYSLSPPRLESFDNSKTDVEMLTATPEVPPADDNPPQGPENAVSNAELQQEATDIQITGLDDQEELKGGAEPETSDSTSSSSSMDESSISARSMSTDPQSEANEQVINQAVEHELREAHESEMSIDDQPNAIEGLASISSLPHSISAVESSKAASVASPEVANASPSDGSRSSRASPVASDVYEPPEPEYNPEEVLKPNTSPRAPSNLETDPVALLSSSAPGANVGLTQKVQEPIATPPSKFPLLDNQRQGDNVSLKFSPYQSPLKYFRSYRFHPDFTKEVSDDFRSLTYSHNIDPMRRVCPYEAAGGVCNDATCDYQHWRDMVITDDKILVQMGSVREGKTPEERESYIEGLKQIINEMRRDQVKDFNTVVTEIAAYRRRFLDDPTRILPL